MCKISLSKIIYSNNFYKEIGDIMKKTILAVVILLVCGDLYAVSELKRCTGCHGGNFEIRALSSNSRIVSEMSEIEIAEVLKGYKNGTYGGSYKVMMQAQVSKYDEKALEAMAKEIKANNNSK